MFIIEFGVGVVTQGGENPNTGELTCEMVASISSPSLTTFSMNTSIATSSDEQQRQQIHQRTCTRSQIWRICLIRMTQYYIQLLPQKQHNNPKRRASKIWFPMQRLSKMFRQRTIMTRVISPLQLPRSQVTSHSRLTIVLPMISEMLRTSTMIGIGARLSYGLLKEYRCDSVPVHANLVSDAGHIRREHRMELCGPHPYLKSPSLEASLLGVRRVLHGIVGYGCGTKLVTTTRHQSMLSATTNSRHVY